jgi:hypothetical protein
MTVKVAASRESIARCAWSVTPAMQPSRVASNQSGHTVRDVPLFIPADQAYYWSNTWQHGEAETRSNLRVGNAKTFDDPLDAIRHLLDDAS